MTFAGDQILACPHCNQLYKNRIVSSYNTVISKYFSDGHQDGLMIPNFICIVKCFNKICGQFFNITQAKEIGVWSNDNDSLIPEEWSTAIALYEYGIDIKELEEALETDFVHDQKNEIQLRTILLRRYNDLIREKLNKSYSRDENAVVNNIERLIKVLNNNHEEDGKLFLAELYREKGDFDTCIKLLNEINTKNENEREIIEKIYSQAKVKDNGVFNIASIAVKREYTCNNCEHNLILFDFEKLNNTLGYNHYRCENDNTIFDSPSRINNPIGYYKLTLWQKLFRSKIPHQNTIQNEIVCPTCKGNNLECFNPELQKCISCDKGSYSLVKWF